jgi:hypothetical protein
MAAALVACDLGHVVAEEQEQEREWDADGVQHHADDGERLIPRVCGCVALDTQVVHEVVLAVDLQQPHPPVSQPSSSLSFSLSAGEEAARTCLQLSTDSILQPNPSLSFSLSAGGEAARTCLQLSTDSILALRDGYARNLHVRSTHAPSQPAE